MARNYLYTFDDIYITDHQRQFYEDNGYLIIRKLVNENLIDLCLERFLDIANGRVKPDPKMIPMKDIQLKKLGKTGEMMYYKLNDILYDDIFYKYASNKNILNIVSSIIGPTVTACHSMIINKPPHADSDSSRHPMHQDMHYFSFGPANKIVAVWTAMERIDARNGCLFGVPGSHKGKLYPHSYPDNVKNPAFHGVYNVGNVETVNFVMEKGDTIFFHPILLHGSGPNYTKGFRRALSVHYANTNSEFYDVIGTTQENVTLELQEIFKRKGVEAHYHVRFIFNHKINVKWSIYYQND
nr:phytanoyl-CoA dioxygenase, peroxisomal-like [Onthophagus taurus]